MLTMDVQSVHEFRKLVTDPLNRESGVCVCDARFMANECWQWNAWTMNIVS